ncbi:hypothetical protein LIER_04503 [Lithospermum erythrorhizon]|uniref:AMP-dependent synthetase/ligase domain-containing protein n=1 Tax=Lithospermum erythrorhizon TaxID=34254 RepID=A0AAV3NWX5_LITER
MSAMKLFYERMVICSAIVIIGRPLDRVMRRLVGIKSFRTQESILIISLSPDCDEVKHMMKLCKPSIVLTYEVSKKLPYGNIPIVDIYSNEFIEMLSEKDNIEIQENGEISQLDSAAILYSSGTTGSVKVTLR